MLLVLDWRTYQSAYEKDKDGERGMRFRQAANNAFNRQNGHGLHNVPYGDGDDSDMFSDGEYYAGNNLYTHKGNRFVSGSGNDVKNKTYNFQSIGTTDYNDQKGKNFSDEDYDDSFEKGTSFNPILKAKQMQGDKQVRNYFNGKTKYMTKKGWS